MDTRNSGQVFSVFVGHLHNNATKEELFEIFNHCGPIVGTYVADQQNEKLYTFGFVRFSKADSAVTAVREMDQWTLQGRKLTVELASDTRDRMIAAGNLSNVKQQRESIVPSPKQLEKTKMSMDHLLNESRFRDCCTEINIQQGIGGNKLNAEKILSDVANLDCGKTSVLHGDLVGVEVGNISYIKRKMMQSEERRRIPGDSTKQFFEVLQEILENVVTIAREGDEKETENMRSQQSDLKLDSSQNTSAGETKPEEKPESEIVASLASAIKKTRIKPQKSKSDQYCDRKYRSLEENVNSVQNLDLEEMTVETPVHLPDVADEDDQILSATEYRGNYPSSHSSDCEYYVKFKKPDRSCSSDTEGESERQRYLRFAALLSVDSRVCATDTCFTSQDSNDEESVSGAALSSTVSRTGCYPLDSDSQKFNRQTDTMSESAEVTVLSDDRQTAETVCPPPDSVQTEESFNTVTETPEKEHRCKDIASYLKQVLHIHPETGSENVLNNLNHTSLSSIPHWDQISYIHTADTSLLTSPCTSSSESVQTVISQPSSDHDTSKNKVSRKPGLASVGRGLSLILDKLQSNNSKPGLNSGSDLNHSSDSDIKTCVESSQQMSVSPAYPYTLSSECDSADSKNAETFQEHTIRHRNMRPKARVGSGSYNMYNGLHLGLKSMKIKQTGSVVRATSEMAELKDLDVFSDGTEAHRTSTINDYNPDCGDENAHFRKPLKSKTDSDFENMAADSGVESDGVYNSISARVRLKKSVVEGGLVSNNSIKDGERRETVGGDEDEKLHLFLKSVGRGRGRPVVMP